MPSPVARLLPVASRRALWVGGKNAPKETQQRRSVARCEELRRNELRLRRFFSRQIHEAVTTRLISFHSANGFSRFARCCSGEAVFLAPLGSVVGPLALRMNGVAEVRPGTGPSSTSGSSSGSVTIITFWAFLV